MTVQINKFGDLLMSHPAGKEAFLLAESHLFNSLDESEEIILDFADVKVLTPSWAEEFIFGFKNIHNVRVRQKKPCEGAYDFLDFYLM